MASAVSVGLGAYLVVVCVSQVKNRSLETRVTFLTKFNIVRLQASPASSNLILSTVTHKRYA